MHTYWTYKSLLTNMWHLERLTVVLTFDFQTELPPSNYPSQVLHFTSSQISKFNVQKYWLNSSAEQPSNSSADQPSITPPQHNSGHYKLPGLSHTAEVPLHHWQQVQCILCWCYVITVLIVLDTITNAMCNKLNHIQPFVNICHVVL